MSYFLQIIAQDKIRLKKIKWKKKVRYNIVSCTFYRFNKDSHADNTKFDHRYVTIVVYHALTIFHFKT